MFVANEAENLLKIDGMPQSILLSGVSGSGKTESAKHILSYLCRSDLLTANITKNIMATNIILETSGNANTGENFNSSRFCKFIQVNFNVLLRI